MNILKLNNITVGYNYPLIEYFSLTLKTWEFLWIKGENGIGKSTIIKAIIWSSTIFSGEIYYQDTFWQSKRTKDFLTHWVLYLHTSASLFLSMTVSDHRESLWYHKTIQPYFQERKEKMLQLIPLLKDWENRKIASLSGGQRQLVMIWLSIIVQPKLLLLDEPTIWVSEKKYPYITTIVHYLKSRWCSWIIIDHHQELLNTWCETIREIT